MTALPPYVLFSFAKNRRFLPPMSQSNITQPFPAEMMFFAPVGNFETILSSTFAAFEEQPNVQADMTSTNVDRDKNLFIRILLLDFTKQSGGSRSSGQFVSVCETVEAGPTRR